MPLKLYLTLLFAVIAAAGLTVLALSSFGTTGVSVALVALVLAALLRLWRPNGPR